MAENNEDYLTTDYCSIHGWGKCKPIEITSVKISYEPPKLPESPEPFLRHFKKKSMKSKLKSLFYGNINK